MNKALKPPGRRPPSPSQVRIDRIGADGDGVSSLPDATPIYVPFTLPGEWVTAEPRRPRGEGWLAHPAAIDQASAARTEPPCAYFGRCGGCALQHWRDQDYVEWKRGLLIAALRRGGFACAESLPLIRSRPHERRRLDFAVRRDPGQILLGLHRTGSAEVIDLTHCTVLHPVLMGLLAPLRTLLQAMQGVRRQASVVINLLSAGPDVLLRTDAELSLADRNGLIGFARAHAVPRVSWTLGQTQPEAICAFRPAVTMLSGIEVRPPPGVFLQTTAEAEQAIIHAVLSGLPARMTGRSRIVELYAGCGTLTFALAKSARVAAWEGDGASVAALKEAVNRAGLASRIDAAQRDLARQPLSVKELAGFSVAVLNPPHAGAAAQIAQIAAAAIASVVYVSCNPATLARDARTLQAAGYALVAATAIDQFLWSARLESVCVFRRP